MFPDTKNTVSENLKEQIAEQEPEETFTNLLHFLEDYAPTIPDAVMIHHLQAAGVDSKDPRIIRLMALVVQKFVTEVVNDTLQRCKIRTSNQPSKISKPKDRQYHLTMEDLVPTLAEYGITVRKPPYFV